MKKIINGKMYNTDTAREVGYYWNGLSDSDFGYISETLYKKKTGEYFLSGRGGARTRYASYGRGCISGGQKIIPYTTEEAKAWMEENCATEDYIKEFGEPEE